jgi:ribosomal protein S18 acetylase RimI-like enzyme
MHIRPFLPADEDTVVTLWQRCDLTRPWNDARKDIARKLVMQPDLFLVGTLEERVVATAMVGYEGHRGWVNYLAVDPQHQRRGFAKILMSEVERRLLALGCPKVNLQVRGSNPSATAFYTSLGYIQDDVVAFSRRLADDA